MSTQSQVVLTFMICMVVGVPAGMLWARYAELYEARLKWLKQWHKTTKEEELWLHRVRDSDHPFA